MRFRLDHHFDAPIERVERAVLDPAYQDRLANLPNIAERSVLELTERPDGSVRRVVKYRFGGNLPGIVVSTIGTSNISWLEIGEFDPQTHTWTLDVQPDVFKGRFEADGHYSFKPVEGGTSRELEVDVRVKVPLVGGRVERAIGEGLIDTMAAEARILATYLKETE